jgi:hypothetical protein
MSGDPHFAKEAEMIAPKNLHRLGIGETAGNQFLGKPREAINTLKSLGVDLFSREFALRRGELSGERRITHLRFSLKLIGPHSNIIDAHVSRKRRN